MKVRHDDGTRTAQVRQRHGGRAGRGLGMAVFVGSMVAVAGCGAVAAGPGIGALVTALGLVLALAGCTHSHGQPEDEPRREASCGDGRPCDADGDGHDTPEDCDDGDPDIHPGVEDRCCDEVDSDCDGYDDGEGVACNCLPLDADLDGDGFGRDVDCDDSDSSIHPEAEDLGGGGCGESFGDDTDNDCDGAIDETLVAVNCFPDLDGDGYAAGPDCNDEDPEIHPEADEQCCDQVDSDCDGYDDPEGIACNCFYDEDGDGYGSGFGPGPDCDDTDPTVHPDATELCDDGRDNDCDEEIDEEDCVFVNPMPDPAPADGGMPEPS